MEATMLILAVIAGLAALGVTSINFGVDSREPFKDDHAR
jgi:hypothetical protein